MTYFDCISNVISNIDYAHSHMSTPMYEEFISEILQHIDHLDEAADE